MEIQIVIMSILSYLILFNSSLTFRLKTANNIVIAAILAFSMIFIRKFISDFFVIPMFIFTVLYIAYLKRADWLWNVFLVIFY